MFFPLITFLSFDASLANILASIHEPAPMSNDFCSDEPQREPYPKSPLVPCSSLQAQWIECEDVAQIKPTNDTNRVFCSYFGTSKGPLLHINVNCNVLSCIECSGPRTFERELPCIKYTNHYFLTTLLYSVFLGILAVDRFYLGYSAIAVGKLMTLGGLGLWWIADIFLLLTGNLVPADESEWQPYF